MDVGRPKKNDYPLYMTPDGDRGAFLVRNPITGKRKRFADEQLARQAATLLAEWVDQERRLKALDAGRPTIASLVEAWLRDRAQFMPWDTRTRQEMGWKMARISRKLGERTVARTDRMFLEDWLNSFCKTADQFNKWRYALTLLWRYAVSRKLAIECEPEKVEPRSNSKKLEANRKVRKQLDVDGFKGIHAAAPAWLKLAMEQSLITLQARTEICSMRLGDYRDGYLYVIRDKVSGDSDMAFIRIKVTEELEALRRRSLTLDGTASPYLVHRKPDNRKRAVGEKKKPHWTHVAPSYLSKAFAEARDGIEPFKLMPAAQRPTFHEIRGLGARLYRASGVAEDAIQALMTHSNRRTTQIYLERGVAALTDEDYHPVTATLSARNIVGANGDK